MCPFWKPIVLLTQVSEVSFFRIKYISYPECCQRSFQINFRISCEPKDTLQTHVIVQFRSTHLCAVRVVCFLLGNEKAEFLHMH